MIPTPLRPFTDKKDAVEAEGKTVGELLVDLTTRHAGLKAHLYNDQGKLRSFVNIYVNDEDIRYLEKEQTAVKPDDTVLGDLSAGSEGPAWPRVELSECIDVLKTRARAHAVRTPWGISALFPIDGATGMGSLLEARTDAEHPMLGKEIIAAAIWSLGDKPLYWRVPSALFGAFGLFAFGRMSEQSRYTRFFAPKRGLSEKEVAHFMNVDFVNHVALVAVAGDAESRRIVGAGRYIVSQPGTAELAFMVDEAYQGRGIASVLIRHLAATAREAGLDGLHAEVLDGNAPMLKVFGKCGLAMSSQRRQGVVHVALSLH
jgi:GNAT superfamily N-acetyltransferase/molybdopterin converting factor small subunit